jgi:hypothetical protein
MNPLEMLLRFFTLASAITIAGCFFDPMGSGVDPAASCGDGVADEGEVCDGSDLRGLSCADLGLAGRGLRCTDDCELDPAECVLLPRCGNGVAEESEACDGADLRAQTCQNLTGHVAGVPMCTGDCTFDTSLCHTCGDGVIGGTERCDGAALFEETCESLGYDGGTLRCDHRCRFEDGQCLLVPDDWFDPSWRYRRPLSIAAAAVAGELVDFPVLVSFRDATIAARTQLDGGDILFTAGDGVTRLDHEVEHYDPTRGWLVAWVRFDLLSGSAPTGFFIYYGNPGCAPQSRREPVWGEDHLGVWHLDEPVPAGGSGATHLDATRRGNHGIQQGNGVAHGQLGLAQRFDGLDDFIDLSVVEEAVHGDADFTVSAWIQTSSMEPMGIVTRSLDGEHVPGDLLIGVNHSPELCGVDQGWVTYLAGVTPVTDGQWHHLAFVQRRDVDDALESWELYVDGELESSLLVETRIEEAPLSLAFGRGVAGSYFASHFEGVIDEVRISRVARSAEWVWTSARNQRAPGAFVVIGPQEGVTLDWLRGFDG